MSKKTKVCHTRTVSGRLSKTKKDCSLMISTQELLTMTEIPVIPTLFPSSPTAQTSHDLISSPCLSSISQLPTRLMLWPATRGDVARYSNSAILHSDEGRLARTRSRRRRAVSGAWMRGAGALENQVKLVSEASDLLRETEGEPKGKELNQEETPRHDSMEESNG